MRTRILLRTTYWAGFLFSLHVALTVYLNSSFLESALSKTVIGLVYTASAVIAVAGLYLVPRFINRFGTGKTLGFLMVANIANLVALSASKNPILIAVCFALYFAFNTLIFLGIDIIVERFTESAVQGNVRGWYLTIVNASYVAAPLIAGFVADRLGFSALYGFSIAMLIPVFIVVSLQLPSIKQAHASKSNILSLARKFIRHPEFGNVFLVNFILQFFYAWMVIYTPIYLHDIVHIPWDTIGIMFAIMLSAFVLFEYPIGKIADWFRAEKAFMMLGLAIMGISTAFFGKSATATIAMLTFILFVTRIGASMVEVSTESYFFKRVNHDDTGTIGFFRNTYPFAYIIAPLIGTVLLRFLPINYFFPILGCICILGIGIVLRIKKVK